MSGVGQCGELMILGLTPFLFALGACEEKCAATEECRTYGRCVTREGRCRPTKDEHCRESTRCASVGHCALGSGGECVAKHDFYCRESEICQTAGMCSAREGACQPVRDADCRRSKACKEGGLCFAWFDGDFGRCYTSPCGEKPYADGREKVCLAPADEAPPRAMACGKNRKWQCTTGKPPVSWMASRYDHTGLLRDRPKPKHGGFVRPADRRAMLDVRLETESAEVRGSLDKEIIHRIVRRHLGELKFCYAQALQTQPKLDGRVVIGFTVGNTGQVAKSKVQSSTLGNREVETCITNAVQRWTFPKPDRGGVVVSYPFVLGSGG